MLGFLRSLFVYSSDFNTTSKTGGWKQPPLGGQAKPEPANATRFIWWFFTRLSIAFEALITARKKQCYVIQWYNKWYFYLVLILTVPNLQYLVGITYLNHITIRFVQPYRIASTSMYPTIHEGEKVMVDKTYNPTKDLKRGDIVLFEDNEHFNKHFIKRVIGLSSESIQFINKDIYINNKLLNEPWELEYSSNPNLIGLSSRIGKHALKSPYNIPDNQVFIVGDNRDMSLDSRQLGAFDINDIKGKVLYIIWSDEHSRIGKIIQ